MARTYADKLAELDALEGAYAEGATSIKIGDRQINLDTEDGTRRRIERLRKELALESAGPGVVVFNQMGFGGRF